MSMRPQKVCAWYMACLVHGKRGAVAQVIVKYASIVLTPEAPEYKGGAWRVEGMKNESIMASGIAYLRCENTTTSRLAFRSMVDNPVYEQAGASYHFPVGAGYQYVQYGVF